MKQLIGGLEDERKQLLAKAREIETVITTLKKLTGGSVRNSGRRTMSASARKKIAAAQRARWAKWRKAKRLK
jgi:hypothetical protein